ncbi:MAG: N-acetyl-gamma-glutamyl-phosphate reductase [Thermoplasmata archaeon]|nr:N-acetyl-gamma-glutamyl-phosphate reductase [Thermoplasmata archaeon]MCI4359154.1 N-acetyl-gamma-glutamyl-phosphate reductase [Thermoplasmata archaeon]
MASAAVLGAGGYLGGELLRLLSNHPSLSVTSAVSKSHAGQSIRQVHPNLEAFPDVILAADAAHVDADVAFLAQPAGEAMQTVPSLLQRGIRAVDLGPDYRLPDPNEYARVYGRPHADPDHLAEAAYGLPELFRDSIRRARLVANPGCYPTASLLAIAPLLEKGMITGPVIVDAKSGTSGAGHDPSPSTHHPEAALTVWPYGAPEHRHVPEMRAAIARTGAATPPIVFVPHLVPLVRGILCSVYPTPLSSDRSRWADVLESRYRDSPFVRVGAVPRLPWALGTNRCYLSVQQAGDAPVVFSAIDNLGKGGAAQAIQNANLLMGWPETTGLDRPGFGV